MCEAVLLTRDGVVDAGPVLTAVSLQPHSDGPAGKVTHFYTSHLKVAHRKHGS